MENKGEELEAIRSSPLHILPKFFLRGLLSSSIESIFLGGTINGGPGIQQALPPDALRASDQGTKLAFWREI